MASAVLDSLTPEQRKQLLDQLALEDNLSFAQNAQPPSASQASDSIRISDGEDSGPSSAQPCKRRKTELADTATKPYEPPMEVRSWMAKYQWFSVCLGYPPAWKNQLLYMPYVSETGKKYSTRLDASYTEGQFSVNSKVETVPVSECKLPQDRGNAMRAKSPECFTEATKVSKWFKLANREGWEWIIVFHDKHYHLLVGHATINVTATQAYKQTFKLDFFSRKVRKQVAPALYAAYLLCDPSKSVVGFSSRAMIHHAVQIYKSARELKIEEPVGYDEPDLPSSDEDDVFVFDEEAYAADTGDVFESPSGFRCESNFTAIKDQFAQSTVKRAEDRWALKAQKHAEKVELLIDRGVYSINEIKADEECRKLGMNMLREQTLVDLISEARIMALVQRKKTLAKLCAKHDYAKANKLWDKMPYVWQMLFIATTYMICGMHPKKRSLVYITSAPNMGKTHTVVRGLEWLKPITKNIPFTGNFPFGQMTSPSFLCIQDDQGMTFDTDIQVECLKNVTAFESAQVNTKYGRMTDTYPQGVVVLSNKSDFEFLSIQDVAAHASAIRARVLFKGKINQQSPPASEAHYQNLWKACVWRILNIPTPYDDACAETGLFL